MVVAGAAVEDPHHRKTMIKVMDPNVHQIMNHVSRRKRSSAHTSNGGGPLDSDEEDDEAYEHRSDLTGHRTVILRKAGVEPKLDMRRKIVRQSDLISSLERSEIRKNEEMLALRQKVREQEATIAEMQ